MNREQRRLFERKGTAKQQMANLINRFMSKPEAPFIREGTKVRLNYSKIVSAKDYKKLVPEYRKFIEESKEKIFTVLYDERRADHPNLVHLEECPKWLLFTGDLEVVE